MKKRRQRRTNLSLNSWLSLPCHLTVILRPPKLPKILKIKNKILNLSPFLKSSTKTMRGRSRAKKSESSNNKFAGTLKMTFPSPKSLRIQMSSGAKKTKRIKIVNQHRRKSRLQISMNRQHPYNALWCYGSGTKPSVLLHQAKSPSFRSTSKMIQIWASN